MLDTLLSTLMLECNRLEFCVLSHPLTKSAGKDGSTRIDMPRDHVISMMREALGSRVTCCSQQVRMQSCHIGDLTLHRTCGRQSKERVTRSRLLKVHDVLDSRLLCLEWDEQHVPQACFPCTTQNDDLRHCIRREIRFGEAVRLCFDTHMNDCCRAVYCVSVHVSDIRDLAEVRIGVTRALEALGVLG